MLDDAAYRVLEFHLTLFGGLQLHVVMALPEPTGRHLEVEPQEVKFSPTPAHVHHMGLGLVDCQTFMRQLAPEPPYLSLREWPPV